MDKCATIVYLFCSYITLSENTWQTYSLDQIIFDVKSIIDILTGTSIDDIEKYFNESLENPTDYKKNE